MDFKLNFPIAQLPVKLNYSDKLVLLGSCFAENIGDKLMHNKFSTCINPHGIIYNPLNIASSLEEYITKRTYTEQDLFFANDCWNSANHHSRFSNPDKSICLSEINTAISEAHDFLKQAKWLVITMGSAYVYRSKQTNELVANCHKVPQKEFTKELVSVEETVNAFTKVLSQLRTLNPELNILLTVSPVRYVRDGVVENNLSKAILIQAVHQLVKENGNCFYFPAYEIVNDELRDYRFFKEDLVHPNELAINFVWERFTEFAFSNETKALNKRITEVLNAMNHKPFNANSDSHKKFKENYFEKIKKLQKEFPFLELNEEENFFRN